VKRSQSGHDRLDRAVYFSYSGKTRSYGEIELMDPGVIALFIPMVAICIPIVVVLTKHQQKMAEIIHGRAQREQIESEFAALRNEVSELRMQLGTVTLALDSVHQTQKKLGDDAIQQRLG
jgi:hypothetical protein